VFHPNGSDVEMSFTGGQVRYTNGRGSSRDRFVGGTVDAPLGNRVRLNGELLSHEFDNSDHSFTGRGQVQVALNDRADVRVGLAREQVASSRMSLAGERVNGDSYGPSYVSQIMLAAAVRPGQTWDVWAQGTMGRIRGSHLRNNARQEVFAGAGKSFYAHSMTLRPGYSLTWMSYELDLSGFPLTDFAGDGVTNPGIGGYFSPGRFLNQMARLDATLPVGNLLFIAGGAGIGRQQVEQSHSRDFSRRVSSSDAYLAFRFRVGERTSINTQVTYQNVASAYNRAVLRMGVTYGF